eukprot:gnl/TRDRNA2_/TRDRNA2_187102_c0_seq1.p1 gnl/TRDRNA2_/TRDRNA2_187102_c0~~gnl/TRDRNA2_/TRDRNA2_187102_c0_seq1.p1  ORF type:complete len:594 (-),score=85.28 gnl/TRDRNA2_/TRDRNA2_187102_c0_seq1:63-1844(-)
MDDPACIPGVVPAANRSTRPSGGSEPWPPIVPLDSDATLIDGKRRASVPTTAGSTNAGSISSRQSSRGASRGAPRDRGRRHDRQRAASEGPRSPSAGLGRTVPRVGLADRQVQQRIAEVDEALARLRPELESTSLRRQNLERRLKTARDREHERSIEAQQKSKEAEARQAEVARKVQSTVRGWLVRRAFAGALQQEFITKTKLQVQQPDLLRDQLLELQHSVHDLVYQDQDQDAAVTRIQAWMRGIFARRVVTILKIAARLRLLNSGMDECATRIQAWYRGYRCWIVMREELQDIKTRALVEKKQQMNLAMKGVIRVQQGIRIFLARKRLQRQREALEGSESHPTLTTDWADSEGTGHNEPPSMTLDTWRGRNGGTVIEKVPSKALCVATDKLETAGLIPFYGSAANELVKHRIGGPTALEIQAAVLGGEDEFPTEPWDVYPEGTSAGFIDRLDEDVSPANRRGRKVRRRSRRRRSTSTCRTPRVLPPPSNTEQRAKAREEAQAKAACQQEAAEAGLELHPLLAGPLLPKPPEAPPPPVPRGRRAPAALEDGGSWAGSTSFYGTRARLQELREASTAGENLLALPPTSEPVQS